MLFKVNTRYDNPLCLQIAVISYLAYGYGVMMECMLYTLPNHYKKEFPLVLIYYNVFVNYFQYKFILHSYIIS